ncbi:hypothetical protein ABXV19_09700 [Pseudomonas alkylphenolica]|uniref:hypothetical protein n=1 Tax=Pseudomonas alkylphenolica TaxID=237609 RepID=UPI003396CA05
MEIFYAVTAALGAIGSIATIVQAISGWVKTAPEQRAEVIRRLKVFGVYVYYSWAVAGALMITVVSIAGVVRFGTSSEALSRNDVLMLVLDIWNGVFYFLSAVVILAFWRKQAVDRRTFRPDSQT